MNKVDLVIRFFRQYITLNYSNIRLITFLGLLLFINICFSSEKLYVKSIELLGLEKVNSKELISKINLTSKQVFEPQLIEHLQNKIITLLSEKGYYFAKISYPDIIPLEENNIKLIFPVEEGNIAVVNKLRFYGNRYFSEKKIRQLLYIPEYTNIPFDQMPQILKKIMDLYTNRGYLFVQVHLDSLILKNSDEHLTQLNVNISENNEGENNYIEAVIQINEGKLFTGGDYRFLGNTTTKPATILKISGLAYAKQFTSEVFVQAENNLRRKSYISDCKILPLDEKTLLIEVKEGKMTRIEGLFGTIIKKDKQSNFLNGFLKMDFLNLWGTDRTLNLNWKRLTRKDQTLSLIYHESGFTLLPIAGDLSFYRTERDSLWVSLKVGLSMYYQTLFQKWGGNLYSESLMPITQNSTVEATVYRKGEVFVSHQKLDYLPNPRKGISGGIKHGLLFSRSNSRQKTRPISEFDIESYFPIKNRWIGYIGIHGRQILDSNATAFERYTMGGFSSLRGYREGEFSSWRLGWVNSELRYLLTNDTKLYLLFDDGMFVTEHKKYKYDLIGFGIGGAFKTKIGTINVSYALSYQEKKISSFSAGIVHIGIISYL